MKAVLFDLDGTLLDRTASLNDFLHWQTYGMLKTDISNKEKFISRFIELDKNGSVWKDKVYGCLIDEFSILNWTVKELLSSYELCFCAFSKPKQGVTEAVKKLREMGMKLAIVSNGKSPFQERNFRALGISDLFDAVIISETVGCRKPEKEIFNLACKMLKTKASNTIFVGDSIKSDIEGAKNAGMYSIYISSDSHQECNDASIICRNFAELPQMVLNAN